MQAITTVPDFPTDGSIKTLGWAVAVWMTEWLVQPDGENAGEAYALTHEQLNFLLWFYAVNDRGRFIYRRAVLRRAKGHGKSPFIAALCVAELVGPVVFAGWDYAGEPIGKPRPASVVVVAGVSETQTSNTLDAVRAMIPADTAAEFGLDVGLTRIYVAGGGKLVGLTTNAATQEGARPHFAVMDEVHHWTDGNGGKALLRVIRRNLGKMSGRSVVTTNAHDPSQDTVGRDYWEAYQKQRDGRTKLVDLLYDCREAPALTTEQMADEQLLREALRVTYGDSWWVDFDALVSEIYSPDTPPEDARRFYLNQIVAAADAWVAPHEWEANRREGLALRRSAPGQWRTADRVALGFDGGRTDDSTALVAVRISDGAAFLLGLWEKPAGPQGHGWEVDKAQVRAAVDNAFATLDVVAFFSDVAEWETDVDYWREVYGERLKVKATGKHAVGLDMRAHQADVTRATEALHRAILDGEVPHDGDGRLAEHVTNARRRPGRYGVSFGKDGRESPRKVDALAALLLARMARTALLGGKVETTGAITGLAGRGRRKLTPAQIAAQQVALAKARRSRGGNRGAD